MQAIATKWAQLVKAAHAPPGANINFDTMYTATVTKLLDDELRAFGGKHDIEAIAACCYLGADLHNLILPYYPPEQHRKVYGFLHVALLGLFDIALGDSVNLVPTTWRDSLSRRVANATVQHRYTHGLTVINQVADALHVLTSFGIQWNLYACPMDPGAYSKVLVKAIMSYPDRDQADKALSGMGHQAIIRAHHGNYAIDGSNDTPQRHVFQGYINQASRYLFCTPTDVLGFTLAYNNAWLFKRYTHSPNVPQDGPAAASKLELDPIVAQLRGVFLDRVMKFIGSIDYFGSGDCLSAGPSTAPLVGFDPRVVPANHAAGLKIETNLFVIMPAFQLEQIRIIADSPFSNKLVSAQIEKWFKPRETAELNRRIASGTSRAGGAPGSSAGAVSTSASGSTSTAGSTAADRHSNFDPDAAEPSARKKRKDKRAAATTAAGGADHLSSKDADDIMASSRTLNRRNQQYDNEFGVVFSAPPPPAAAPSSPSPVTGSASATAKAATTSSTKKNKSTASSSSNADFDIDDLQSFFS